MANTNIQFYTDTRTVFSTSNGQAKTSIGSANGTVQGLEIEYNLGVTGANEEVFKIYPLGINYTSGAINYTTPLDRIAQVGSLIQSLETPPDATTLQVDKRILLNYGVSTGSIGISGVNTQVTSSGNLILDPVTSIVDLSANTLDMGGGKIINCPLIQSVKDNDIIVEGTGTGDVILKTGATNRLTISETGAMTFHGGMSGSMGYDNATNTLTATNFAGTVTKVSLANNNNIGTFYPVFAQGSGSQSLFVDNVTGPFSIDPSNGIIRLSNTMKIENGRIGFGSNAGVTGQGTNTVAIGTTAGQLNQTDGAVAIGNQAGATTQGFGVVAIGNQAGATGQGFGAVAIGDSAGTTTQGDNAVAIGIQAGQFNQTAGCVAIGNQAGATGQGVGAVAIGNQAGATGQGEGAIAIGNTAGQSNQGASAIAIGNKAGPSYQVANSICINASGFAFSANQAGLFIRPIRGFDHKIGVNRLHYNPSTYELTYSTT